jgi:hypothetical protein
VRRSRVLFCRPVPNRHRAIRHKSTQYDGALCECAHHTAKRPTHAAASALHSQLPPWCAPQEEAVFSGDVVLPGGCGRLFRGTAATAMAILNDGLFACLPGAALLFPGHEYTVRAGERERVERWPSSTTGCSRVCREPLCSSQATSIRCVRERERGWSDGHPQRRAVRVSAGSRSALPRPRVYGACGPERRARRSRGINSLRSSQSRTSINTSYHTRNHLHSSSS